MYRKFLRPGWIVGHLMVVLAVLVCLRLGRWQWDRTEHGGTVQNLGYAILWPVFGAAFVYMWFRFLQLELVKDAEDDEELTRLAAGEQAASALTEPAAGSAPAGAQGTITGTGTPAAEPHDRDGRGIARPPGTPEPRHAGDRHDGAPSGDAPHGGSQHGGAPFYGAPSGDARDGDARESGAEAGDRIDDDRNGDRSSEGASPAVSPPRSRRTPSRGVTVAVATVGDENDDDDPELAAYNRALAALAEKDHRRAH